MANNIESVSYKSGSYITVEGEAHDGCFYLIQEGSVILSQSFNIPGYSSMKLGSGDFFEVESALTNRRKLFTAVAATDCKVIVVPNNMFDSLIQKKPTFVQKVILSFSKKMRELDNTLAKVSFSGKHNPTSGGLDHLLHVAEYYADMEQIQSTAFVYNYFIKNASSDHSQLQYVKDKFKTIQDSYPDTDFFLEQDPTQLLRTFPPNTMIFSENMSGDTMYFIQSGKVKICKISKKSEIVLAVLGKGELFGEMALLEEKPRSATAIATEESSLLVINYQNFPTIIKRQPSLITRITTMLANRIWFIYRQIANVMLPEGQERLYDALMLFMEKEGIKEFGKTPIVINMSVKDLIRYTGMDDQKGLSAFNDLVNANAVRVTKEDVIQVQNPIFVYNRSVHFREAKKAAATKLSSK